MAGIGANDAWEYLSLPEGEADPDRLAALGRERWELVTRGGLPEEPVLYFKRRLPHFREVVTLDQRRAYYASLAHQPREPERSTR